jgi:non-homologous end joining protein Ku
VPPRRHDAGSGANDTTDGLDATTEALRHAAEDTPSGKAREFMAPRANWKGFLRLSFVTCPVALFPATSESEKISFNQINKKTGHRIRYLKVDADTGEEVSNEDIIKGYQVDKDRYLEVTKDELENIALESTRTIEIDEFVPRTEIVETKAGHFEPAKFQDHNESALQELLEKKQKGQPIAASKKAPPATSTT